MIKKLLFLTFACIAFSACGNRPNIVSANLNSSTAKPAFDRAAEEKALSETDLAWSAAASRGDVEATAAFMSDDGVTMSPNVPLAKGKDAIKKEWQGLLGLKDGTISWSPTTVQVADSGDLGYTSGTWQMSWTDPKQGKLQDHGKYLEVWKKTSGKWLCTYDMYSSDLSAPTTLK